MLSSSRNMKYGQTKHYAVQSFRQKNKQTLFNVNIYIYIYFIFTLFSHVLHGPLILLSTWGVGRMSKLGYNFTTE